MEHASALPPEVVSMLTLCDTLEHQREECVNQTHLKIFEEIKLLNTGKEQLKFSQKKAWTLVFKTKSIIITKYYILKYQNLFFRIF